MDDLSDQQLDALARSLGEQAVQAGAILAAAESCTGGWIAKVLTDIGGSSRWFDRGFVTYSNQAKNEMLGVPMSIIDAKGAVSAQTVEAMAVGALQHSHANLSVAVSGIAGPGGGTKAKPVGLVWFAWGRTSQGEADNPRVVSESRQFSGDRTAVRRQAVRFALIGLISQLEQSNNADS